MRIVQLPILSVMLVAACSNAPVPAPGAGHLSTVTPDERTQPADHEDAGIPAPVTQVLARPKRIPPIETYSVVVNNVPVRELLFALARDAKLNVDIHSGIEGFVTLNAIDQTLQQLLTRIARQIDLRWEMDGANLSILPDTPYLHTYPIDYVNIARDVSGMVAINTQIASTSPLPASETNAPGNSATHGNNSSTTVRSTARNNFWETLERNIKDILRETDKILPAGSSETTVERQEEHSSTGTGAALPSGNRSTRSTSGRTAQFPTVANSPNPVMTQQQGAVAIRHLTYREAAAVISNPEAGMMVVRATARQHEKIREYLDQVLANSRRQVIIEATIAEVTLGNQYQQGINWGALGESSSSLLQFTQGPISIGSNYFSGVMTAADEAERRAAYKVTTTPPAGGGNLAFARQSRSGKTSIGGLVTLLETFGNVKVLSSPKISVLNNQTAMLKVVDNVVYFTIKADTTSNANGPLQTTVTTTPNSVSVGLVMSVTPQIGRNDNILMNVRPTISRIIGYKADPNPLIPASLGNAVPEIQTREMESMLRLADGEIAILGGLMEDRLNHQTSAIPGAGALPVLGNLFRQRNDLQTKTELVILLRPTIIRDPGIGRDYRKFSSQLPRGDFFEKDYAGPRRQVFDGEDRVP